MTSGSVLDTCPQQLPLKHSLCSAAAPPDSLEQHAVQHAGGCSRPAQRNPHHCPLCAGNRRRNDRHYEITLLVGLKNLNSAFNRRESAVASSPRFKNLMEAIYIFFFFFDWCPTHHQHLHRAVISKIIIIIIVKYFVISPSVTPEELICTRTAINIGNPVSCLIVFEAVVTQKSFKIRASYMESHFH